jgi:predicted HTH domain antitoxin
MAYKTIATRVPKEIDEFLEKIMKEEKLDKSTTTRKLLELGIAEWRSERAIDLLRNGKVTLAKAAEIAGISIYEMIELVKEKKIDYIHIAGEELEEDLRLMGSEI